MLEIFFSSLVSTCKIRLELDLRIILFKNNIDSMNRKLTFGRKSIPHFNKKSISYANVRS